MTDFGVTKIGLFEKRTTVWFTSFILWTDRNKIMAKESGIQREIFGNLAVQPLRSFIITNLCCAVLYKEVLYIRLFHLLQIHGFK